ncbi:MAG: ATP-binding cassette domain-containing protein [Alphaproteobacteria bacterium]|nr:ATP-binding cassette domain-containing protein [Alphaproteobacteria bacterium]
MLTLNNLQFHYKDAESFSFDTSFKQGNISLITGKSGAGKSTLLNLIAGFYPAQSGSISYNHQQIQALPPAKRNLSFLFQAHNLFPHLTVLQNIMLAFAKNKHRNQKQIIDDMMSLFRLNDYHAQIPENLSGGQQQRVALARIFAQIDSEQCKILLLDEPFNGLDEDLRQMLMGNIQQRVKKFNLTCLLVSHHPQEMMGFIDESFHVTNGSIMIDDIK